MKLLPALAVLASLGRAAAAQPAGPAISTADAQSLTQNARTLLDARDAEHALADAEAAVQAGGGADAYAARAQAKIALNRPDAGLIDYAEAARRDPARYGAKYRALQAQLQPKTDKAGQKAAVGGVAGISIFFIIGLACAGVALLIFGFLFLRRKKTVGKSASEL
ncbi:MAG TPA: hypothetical protein VN915_16060 [Elusimicrobiota bacterium]|nr:hypothetical protein [Elusimicrobiota bacterium]